jgi:hypothetical protein
MDDDTVIAEISAHTGIIRTRTPDDVDGVGAYWNLDDLAELYEAARAATLDRNL